MTLAHPRLATTRYDAGPDGALRTIVRCSAALAQKLLAERFTPRDFGIQCLAIYQLGNHGTARLRLWPA